MPPPENVSQLGQIVWRRSTHFAVRPVAFSNLNINSNPQLRVKNPTSLTISLSSLPTWCLSLPRKSRGAHSSQSICSRLV